MKLRIFVGFIPRTSKTVRGRHLHRIKLQSLQVIAAHPCWSSSQPARLTISSAATTMDANASRPERRDGAFSSLNAAIETSNLAKEASRITLAYVLSMATARLQTELAINTNVAVLDIRHGASSNGSVTNVGSSVTTSFPPHSSISSVVSPKLSMQMPKTPRM